MSLTQAFPASAHYLRTLGTGLLAVLLFAWGSPIAHGQQAGAGEAAPRAQTAQTLPDEIPPALKRRLSEQQLQRLRAAREARPGSGRQDIGGFPEVTPAQSWSPNENPNSQLNFSLLGTPQFAGDVNGDGINDYLYATARARDERTPDMLEDVTAKTALFYGGTPSETEDQFFYTRLHPVGDLNADGYDDAVEVDRSSGTVRVYTGSDSGYQDSGVQLSPSSIPTGLLPRGFVDVDGDGYEDLVLGSQSQDAFLVIYGANVLEDATVVTYAPGSTLSAFQYNVADLGGSSGAEIVRLIGSTFGGGSIRVQVFEIGSGRSLTLSQDAPIEELGGRAFRHQLSLVDVNGSGEPELVTNRRFGSATYFLVQSSGVAFDATPIPDPSSPNAVPVGDLDGDGQHDFFTVDEATGTRYVAFGPDDLSAGLSYDTEIPYGSNAAGTAGFVPQGGLGDVTGDGRPDAGLSLTNNANRTVGRRFFSVNSDRTGRPPADVSYPRGHFFDSINETNEIGDLNDDGTTDFAVVRSDLGRVEVFYGGSSIGQSPDLIITPPADSLFANSVTGGDFDGDGVSDLLVGYAAGAFAEGGLRTDIYLGSSSPDATSDHTIRASDVGFRLDLPRAIGDVNADGVTDWMATDRGFTPGLSSQNVAIFFGGAPLPTTPDETLQYPDGTFLGEVKAGVGDVNGDGVDDFAFDNTVDGHIAVYFGGSSPSFSPPADLALPVTPYAGIAGGDFNGDGVSDIAAVPCCTQGNALIEIFHGGTNADATADQQLPIPAGIGGGDTDGDGIVNATIGVLESPGDVNGDGADELVHGSSFFGFGTNALLYRPSASTLPAKVFKAPNQDASLGAQQFIFATAVGDFTGNGMLDFVGTQYDDNNDAARSSRLYRYEIPTNLPPVNQPPVAEADMFSTPQGQTLTVEAPGVLENDSDPDGDSLSASLVSGVSDGSLTLDADGSFEYTPNSGFVGQDAFTYAASDGNVSDTADVVVSVTGEVQGLTITSFRPQSGVPGSQIRIYGSGFDPAPENNTVTVGGTTAAVDSAGSNVLYVTVPAGASGPLDLSVSTEGTTATAAQPFTSITGGAELFADAQAELVNVSRGDVDWGDYNGDGRLDVAVTGSDEARIYRNEGDGTFTDIQAGLTGVGEDTSVEWGDYNNDGALDLAVLGNSNGSGTTTIYRNDGNGTFTDIDAGLIGLIRGSVDWGDYNRDGRLDIVVTGFDDDDVARTRIYRNDGGGTFTSINAGLQGVSNSSAEWGDYNGDGRLDLVVTGSFSATIYRNDGEGAFTDIGAGLTGVNFGTSASWGDYNRDGRLDVVVTGADPNGGTTTLYRNNGNDTFTAVNAGLTDVEQGDVAWGNFTGDGALDLVVTGRDENDNATATLYRNEGGGSFMAVDAGLSGVTFSAQAGGDFDGDGTLDLLVTGSGGSTTVYENQGSGAGNSPPTAADDNFSTPQGQTLTVEAPGVLENDIDPDGDSLTASLVENTSDGSLAFDADGSFEYTPDAEFLGQDAFTYEAIDDSSAADTATVSIDVVPPGGPPAFTRSGQGLTGVQDGASTHWLDADGDGDQDLLVTGWDESFDQSATIYENDGTGTLTPMNAGLSGVRSGDADVGDIDGDGDVDLVITGEGSSFDPVATVYENDGQGNFTAIGADLTGVEDGSATFGDFDQDGDLDLVITGRDENFDPSATIYENDGSGNFTAVGAGLTGVESSSTDWADIDGDSDLDLVVTGVASGGSSAGADETIAGRERECRGASAGDRLRGRADAEKRREEHRPLPRGSSDCVGQRQGPPTTTVYENQGGGTFAPLNAGLTGVEGGAARFGDADGDGNPDLVVTGQDANFGGVATLYENDGSGNFTAVDAGLAPVEFSSAEWTDLRSDGDQDLILTGFGPDFNRTATIYENDGQGNFTALDAGLTGVFQGASAAADADGDGDVDVAVAGDDNLIGPSVRLYVNRRLQEDPNRSPRFASQLEPDTITAGVDLSKPIEAGDPDGDPIDLQLTTGAQNATFVDNENGTGEFVFTPDRSQLGQTFTFTFEATDGQGGSATSSFSVRVPDQFAALNAGLQGVNASATAIGDVDNDGNQDLVITGRRGGGTTVYLGDGQGGFTPANAGLAGFLDGSISTGDVNNDGNLDLLFTGRESETFEATTILYLGDGQGGFTEANAGLTGVTRSSSSIADVDDDGNLDLLIAGRDVDFNDVTTLYLGDGQGNFTEAGAGLADVGNASTSIADVNADGAPDLLITGSGTATVYLGDGQGGFTDANAGLEGINGGSTSIADLDNDGNQDLLIAGSETATVYLGDGQGSFANANAGLVGIRGGTTSVEDFDGDGNSDLLIAGSEAFRDPLTALYFGDGEGNFDRASAGLVDVRFGASSSTGDIDGDQDPDLLLTGRRTIGNPTATLYENLLGGEQQCPLAWSLGVTGSDVSEDTVSVTVGQSAAATAGIDPACGEEEQPPKPPSEVFDLRFTGTDLPGVDLGEGLVRDIRPTDQPTPAAESAPATWRLEVQSENYPVTLTWDNAALADSLPGVPVRLVDVVTGGDLVDVNMKQVGSYTLENSSVTALEIRLDRALTREVPIESGWNLLSVPLQADDPSFGAVLPLCESGFFFDPGSGYNGIGPSETVPVGRGLFANCSAGTAQVTGQAPGPTIEVAQGWNIIGALADSVDVGAITSDPPGIVQTSFFGFDQTSGYQNASTLGPGRGYWVKVGEGGTLDLSGSSGGAAALASKALASTPAASGAQNRSGAQLQITDAAGRTATLRLAQDVSEKRLQRASLPPVPPGGVFDVRFEGGRSVAEAGGDALRPIQTQGLKAPVTIKLTGAEGGQSVRLRRRGETTRLTAERSSATLSSTEGLAVGLQAAPEAFALKKTYPNPASGRATVEYAVPEQSDVTIAVYDVLGRRVATLADGREEAGRHTARLGARQLPSGTYFVRMRAEGFQQTRRLTVVQ